MIFAFRKMKFALTVVSVFYLLIGTDNVSGNSPVQTKWMMQKIDNFDENNKATWYMRYMVNDQYFKKNGPIFIYVGGEIPIKAPFIEWGLLVDLAAEHNGILFYTEHRYYGESRLGRSLSMENLKFLNAKQALADLAHFIRTQRQTDPRLANSKVIISGCSYAGSLAVWFNRLYPELVDGTWAISAPILAKADFAEYLEITGEAMKALGSPQCFNRIKRGIEELEKMFNVGRAKEASKILNLCDHFDYKKTKDIWTLFRAISHLFSELVTYQKLEKEEIPQACNFLMKRPNDLTAVADYFLEHFSSIDNSCKSLNYLGTVYYHSNTSYDNIISRQWMYQTCNEFGWFQSSISKRQPFGRSSPSTLDFEYCKEIFGSDFTEERIRQKIAETNRVFGGLNPNVKNVFMTHGGLDPWSALGHSETQYSTIVPMYSHCAHIDSISDKDSPEMVASKQRLFVLVRKWLA